MREYPSHIWDILGASTDKVSVEVHLSSYIKAFLQFYVDWTFTSGNNALFGNLLVVPRCFSLGTSYASQGSGGCH